MPPSGIKGPARAPFRLPHPEQTAKRVAQPAGPGIGENDPQTHPQGYPRILWISDPAHKGGDTRADGGKPPNWGFPSDGAQIPLAFGNDTGFATRVNNSQPRKTVMIRPTATGARYRPGRRIRRIAHGNGAIIHRGHPIASLQGLDTENRVIYIGSFSKTLLPGLHAGYVIVPPDLVPAFSAVRPMLDRFPPSFQQRVIADFLNEGYFPVHLRRLRESYRASRDMLVDLLQHRLGDHLIVEPPEQGIHLTARSTGTWKNDKQLSECAHRKGVIVIPVSPMYISAPTQDKLILGFSGLSEQEADVGTRLLVKAFSTNAKKSVST